ncbi:hypothetical protein D9M68_616630 [compost metagenome]
MAHILGIFSWIDQADARSLAALDLVLQAGPCAVFEVAVFTLADQEGFLQQVEAFANRPRAGVRAKIAAFLLLRPTVDAQPWVIAIREKYVGIGLIVAQQDVVGRPPLLDQCLFEQQGFGFIGGNRGFDLDDPGHQRSGLRRQTALAEVARQAFLQVFRLADIEQLGVRIEHAVNAGAAAAGSEEGAGVERGAHFNWWHRPCRDAQPAGPAPHHW